MKFKIETVWEKKFDEIIKKYPVLNEYPVYKENNLMYLNIKTLDLLVGDFMEDIGYEIIIKDEEGLCIEIYDSYRE